MLPSYHYVALQQMLISGEHGWKTVILSDEPDSVGHQLERETGMHVGISFHNAIYLPGKNTESLLTLKNTS